MTAAAEFDELVGRSAVVSSPWRRHGPWYPSGVQDSEFASLRCSTTVGALAANIRPLALLVRKYDLRLNERVVWHGIVQAEHYKQGSSLKGVPTEDWLRAALPQNRMRPVPAGGEGGAVGAPEIVFPTGQLFVYRAALMIGGDYELNADWFPTGWDTPDEAIDAMMSLLDGTADLWRLMFSGRGDQLYKYQAPPGGTLREAALL